VAVAPDDDRRLTFTTLVTLYTLITSRNEETRLREAYGQVYADYQAGAAGYLVPTRIGDTG